MAQHREMEPVTVYLPPAARQEADRRATDSGIALATLLRLILIGKQPSLELK